MAESWDQPKTLDAETVRELTEGAIRPLPGAPDFEEAFYADRGILLVMANKDVQYMHEALFLAFDWGPFSRCGWIFVPFGDERTALLIRPGVGVGHSWEELRNQIMAWAAHLDVEIDIRWPINRAGAAR
jgi:hypothetical protein